MWFPTLLIALGFLLIFIELLILPGFGAAGVPGIVLICTGLGIIWWKIGFYSALIYGSIALVFAIPIAIVGLSMIRETPLGNVFILKTSQKSDDGFQAMPPELKTLVGKSGTAITPLRPTGVALIDGHRVDIVTRGEFVETETEVEVILVEGNRVVVRSL